MPLRREPAPSVDLHSHSDRSDGVLDPRELVRRAAAAGVEVLALTDHDTMEGVPAAEEEARAQGLHLLPGMEVSSRLGERGLHLLAYFPPGARPPLDVWQAERRERRTERLERMLDRLEALGLPVDRERLLHGPDRPRGNPGRPHVARALLRAGHVTTMQEAFDRFLGDGAPAYVRDQVPDAARALDLVHAMGGLTVVAHPAVDGLDEVLEELAGLGLDGVEAYHSSHDAATAAHFHARARDLGLLVTGGSDYHGTTEVRGGEAGGSRLGGVDLPPDEWERFVEALTGAGRAPEGEA